jgi:hypothetical protein
MRLNDFLQQQKIPTSAAVIRGIAEWLDFWAPLARPADGGVGEPYEKTADLLREEAGFTA